jgi:hypothetical protein
VFGDGEAAAAFVEEELAPIRHAGVPLEAHGTTQAAEEVSY